MSWLPKFFNRNNPDTWIQDGGKTYGEVVAEKTTEILATHRPEPLPEEIGRQIDEISRRAEEALSDKHFAT